MGLVVDMVPTSELPPERLVEPLEALEAGVPPELVELGLWVARAVLLDAGARAGAGAAARDRHRPATARRRPRARELLAAELTAGRPARAAAGPGRAWARASTPRSRRSPDGPLLVAELTRPHAGRARRAEEPRAPRPGRGSAAGRSSGARRRSSGAAAAARAAGAARAHRRPARARSTAVDGAAARARGTSGSCSTA